MGAYTTDETTTSLDQYIGTRLNPIRTHLTISQRLFRALRSRMVLNSIRSGLGVCGTRSIGCWQSRDRENYQSIFVRFGPCNGNVDEIPHY